ncbi:TOMM precursor leader peptide-binding protein [Kitasatospora sp. GP82]|uniref:TOMM precursor leader peptide-binding protein n=1 Tax=Kitasatospora sp. GP82 TaxID=3035089 RepID=UPI0024734534|nr:TOMM precursor leader peptide-binding protein [Kitasatospora sp. GP82]MDH6130001.1 ribosomal protein S12 methylthiotransferase accessory factor [Kitasatospora sp. GP82]
MADTLELKPDTLPGPRELARACAEALGLAAEAVSVHAGWDLDRERTRWQEARDAGREHLSVRLSGDEILLGPLWSPDTDSGCAGCAETRSRIAVDHPLAERLEQPRTQAQPVRPFLPELLAAVLAQLSESRLAPGELIAVGVLGVRRHRILRSFNCRICAPVVEAGSQQRKPPELRLDDLPASEGDPSRGRAGARLLRPGALRERLVDARYGPVLQVMRDLHAPYAMSNAVVPESPAFGYGRALTFADAEPVAILEAYERLGSFPHHGQVVRDLSYRDVAAQAVDPALLGGYTAEQLAHPLSRVIPSTPDTRMDWVWGQELGGDRVLVPADIGFYRYEYLHREARHDARRDHRAARRRNFFPESSSGCALGSSRAEAALHSLLELAERDAFLLAWHRAMPLPTVDPATVTDPVSRRLLDTIDAHGYDAYLLVTTRDIDLPLVWGLAVNRTGGFPATWSAAGSGVHPEAAIRAALWELTQLITTPTDWDRGRIEPMLDDPWQVDVLEDHLRLYNLPETLPRVTSVLGGPRLPLTEAFPGWPDRIRQAAGGTVRGALEYVADLFGAAGLDRIVLVDQSTRDHTDLGLAVVKAVVPGILPMCFGQAQQRLAGLPRLAEALAGTAQGGRPIPYDPHPFP